ncbi:NAD(P)-dependent oxidoreductase [Algirhabdus cladophorae]|uniref:NAD(P)-dependent oxidoreductase n=1 Tax=Algirhabdus cladophorae TaxID=3377108 RepID=UPI003B846C0F
MSVFTVISSQQAVAPVAPLVPQVFDEVPTSGRADRAMTLILMLAQGTHDLADSVLGLVGWDETARNLAIRASVGFGMRVHIYVPHDAAVPRDFPEAVRIVSELDVVLRASDFISLHGPHVAGQPAVMTAERMNLMREDACLINTSHCELVNELALTQALWFETIGGAGLDLSDRVEPVCAALRDCDQLVSLDNGPAASTVHIFPAAQAR